MDWPVRFSRSSTSIISLVIHRAFEGDVGVLRYVVFSVVQRTGHGYRTIRLGVFFSKVFSLHWSAETPVRRQVVLKRYVFWFVGFLLYGSRSVTAPKKHLLVVRSVLDTSVFSSLSRVQSNSRASRSSNSLGAQAPAVVIYRRYACVGFCENGFALGRYLRFRPSRTHNGDRAVHRRHRLIVRRNTERARKCVINKQKQKCRPMNIGRPCLQTRDPAGRQRQGTT